MTKKSDAFEQQIHRLHELIDGSDAKVTWDDRISALLDEIIKTRKAKALDYEAYLKRIGELVAYVVSGGAAAIPYDIRCDSISNWQSFPQSIWSTYRYTR